MGAVLSVLMKHDYIGNGQTVPVKILWMIDIKAGVNILKRKSFGKLRLIYLDIVIRVKYLSRFF